MLDTREYIDNSSHVTLFFYKALSCLSVQSKLDSLKLKYEFRFHYEAKISYTIVEWIMYLLNKMIW